MHSISIFGPIFYKNNQQARVAPIIKLFLMASRSYMVTEDHKEGHTKNCPLNGSEGKNSLDLKQDGSCESVQSSELSNKPFKSAKATLNSVKEVIEIIQRQLVRLGEKFCNVE